MNKLLGILALVPLGICIVCAFQESKVTAPYKQLGIYSRWSAYLAMDFTFAGIAVFLMGVFAPVMKRSEFPGKSSYAAIVGGALLFCLGAHIYLRAYQKCPAGMRKRVLLDMLMTGAGVAAKIALFFLPVVWRLATDTHVVYVPHKIVDTLTGKKYTFVNSYGNTAVYEDENGFPHVLENVERFGNTLSSNGGVYREAGDYE